MSSTSNPPPLPVETVPVPITEPLQDASSSSSMLLVSDAKHLISVEYPKLNSRFNYAFHGHDDSTPLAEAVSAITSDVHSWLKSMPDNFKTSNHALSRPKYGLVFVLRNDSVRSSLGEQFCSSAIDTIERMWDECKKDIVNIKDDVPLLETEDELRAKLDDLTIKYDILSAALINVTSKQYDNDIGNLIGTLLKF